MTKIPDCCIFPQPHELGKKVDLIQRKTFLIFLSLVNSKCLLNLKIAIFFSVLKLGLTMNLTYCLDVSENYCIAFWCFILMLRSPLGSFSVLVLDVIQMNDSTPYVRHTPWNLACYCVNKGCKIL